MNDRIKQLYTQVCMEQKLPFTLEHNSVYMMDAFADKFAELIVKECITKVEMRREFAIEDDHNVDEAFSLLIYDIESHFGVEE